MHLNARGEKRPGLSLLEVILSLAILVMSISALGFLMTTSTNAAMEAKHRSQAALYAQSKLGEVRAGSVAMQGVSDAPLDDDDDYMWSMDVQAGAYQGLMNVTVKVWRDMSGKRIEVSMSQIVLDPQFLGSSQDGSGTNSTTESGTTSGTTGSSGSSGGSSGSPAASSPAASAPRLGGSSGGSMGGGKSGSMSGGKSGGMSGGKR